jgi:hypothetical protein
MLTNLGKSHLKHSYDRFFSRSICHRYCCRRHYDRVQTKNKLIDVNFERPLEVIGHDGKAYNVTMEPGDLVLYESHSIIHGTYVCRMFDQTCTC